MNTIIRNNNLTKSLACLPITALLITTAIADHGGGYQELPFNGTIGGTEDFHFPEDDPNGIDLLVQGTGGGSATHLGKFTAAWEGDITFDIPEYSGGMSFPTMLSSSEPEPFPSYTLNEHR